MATNTIYDGAGRLPIDSAASSILNNRGAIKAEDDIIEERIAELIQLKLEADVRLAEIDADINESGRQYREYGVAGNPEEYKKLKVEQARTKNKVWLAVHEIERLKQNRSASRAREVSKHFMALAKADLPSEQFFSLLRRAEVLAAARA